MQSGLTEKTPSKVHSMVERFVKSKLKNLRQTPIVKADAKEEGANPWIYSHPEENFDSRTAEQILSQIDFTSMPDGSGDKIKAGVEEFREVTAFIENIMKLVLFFFDLEAEIEIGVDGNLRIKITEYSNNSWLYDLFGVATRKMDFEEKKAYGD